MWNLKKKPKKNHIEKPYWWKSDLQPPPKEMLLDIDQLSNFLSTITYKPNCTIAIIDKNYIQNLVTWQIKIPMEDSNGQILDDPILVSTIATPALYPKACYKNVIRAIFQSLELHEIDEWLRIDGIRLNDPHPDGLPSTMDTKMKCTIIYKNKNGDEIKLNLNSAEV